jgi:hypothetical protein
MLPYFFVLELVVKHLLPKYAASLPVAGILLFGIFFLAEIQILHTSFAYINGKQREFLLLTILASVVTFGIGLAMAILVGSLVAIAVGQLVSLATWWFINDWVLRATTGQTWSRRFVLLAVFTWSVISYELATRFAQNVGVRILLYYLLVGVCLYSVCRPELEILSKLFKKIGEVRSANGEAVT